jgi:hypothetical protein
MSDTIIRELTEHYTAVRKRLTSPNLRVVEIAEPEPESVAIPVVHVPAPAPEDPGAPIAELRSLSVKTIAEAVARKFNVTVLDIACQRRTADLVRPRQIVFYLARTLTGLSLPVIGRAVGNRDHTTALHGFRKIEKLRQTDGPLHLRLLELEVELTGARNGMV